MQKRHSEISANFRYFSAMDEYGAAFLTVHASASAAALAKSIADMWLAAVKAVANKTVSPAQKSQLASVAANYATVKASADAAAGKADAAVKAAQAAEAAAEQKPPGMFGFG